MCRLLMTPGASIVFRFAVKFDCYGVGERKGSQDPPQ